MYYKKEMNSKESGWFASKNEREQNKGKEIKNFHLKHISSAHISLAIAKHKPNQISAEKGKYKSFHREGQ